MAAAPLCLTDLRGAIGAPGSTLRTRLSDLEQAGAVVSRRAGLPGGAVEYRLARGGKDLLSVAGILEAWLGLASNGGRPLGDASAKAAIAALCEGWSAMLLRPLAAKPHSVSELDQLIAQLSYPTLERRIAAMRLAGQVEARPAAGRETPYAVTDWLRRAVAPLLVAIQWEGRWLDAAERPPVSPLDFETVFLLAVPLVKLAGEHSGSCRLAVEFGGAGDGNPRLAGVVVQIRDGAVTACTSRLDGDSGAWAVGGTSIWLRALIDDDRSALEVGGDAGLARAVTSALHRTFIRQSGAQPA